MPSGRNWLNFIFVNLGFILQVSLMYYWIMSAEIKKDWNKYRCNPMYMPLSDNLQSDFTFCVQNIQTDYMGYLLQPLTFITASLTDLGGSLNTDINGARGMISNIRSFTTDTVSNIFAVFLNLVNEFQRTTINIKDLVGKVVGILVTALYIMDGSNKTIVSLWSGPSGEIVRKIGNCFHPNTQVKLQNNEICFMKDLELGAILENGSSVESVMKINNKFNEPMYKLSCADKNTNIYVTGTHLVEYDNKFIQVKEHPLAEIQAEDMNSKWFSCLITSDHKIPIGDYIFWDWEDDIITGISHL